LLRKLAEAFYLLEDDYLGGGGSRGSGRVKFEKVKVIFRSKDYYSSGKGEGELSEGGINALIEASEKLQNELS